MKWLHLVMVTALFAVTACRGGGDIKEKCKGPTDYLSAAAAPRVKAPEDLDELDELRELPVPEVSPQDPWTPENGCLDLPPDIGEN
ncbi:MAG: hypothetical protein GWN47_06360 [Woeseiaceae bacterium]|nr:hypothetical protein [Woeseiaceae bacterium]